VPRLEACLVDAYDTIVTCDFSILRNELSALAGISPDTWQVGYARIGALVSDGRLSKAEAFAQILLAAGREARPGLVAELVRQDQDLLLANARLYDDAIPFLRGLRERGIKVAIVSNCTENTRPLLVKHGVDALADTLVTDLGQVEGSGVFSNTAMARWIQVTLPLTALTGLLMGTGIWIADRKRRKEMQKLKDEDITTSV